MIRKLLKTALATLLFLAGISASAQNAAIRGTVLDKKDGVPLPFATIRIEGTDIGTVANTEGFFILSDIPPGDYVVVIELLGYGAVREQIALQVGALLYKRFFMEPEAIELQRVDISAERQLARISPQVGLLTVSREQILSMPAIGASADLAQYLSLLPGVVSTGDQGGQLYLRGGAPVQNKVLLDGMTLFNPFHSIGLFSVFETETIRSADIHSAGFQSEYGGRMSAVMDIKTREGNTQKFSGLVAASPFQAKALLEGPIKQLGADGGAISFLVTGKQGILDRTSPYLYPFAVDSAFYAFAAKDTSLSALQELSLPYRYTDVYAKVSWLGGNGSKLDIFGINFRDGFDFAGLARLDWVTSGGGARFVLVPQQSDIFLDGAISYTSYQIGLDERGEAPRSSGVNAYSANLNFTYFANRQQLNYGFEFSGFSTDFRFRNPFGLNFTQRDFTSEIAGYLKYRYNFRKLILEPGFRLHFYASQSRISPEPRLAVKYNVLPTLRLKAAGGWYSQNLLSTVNDLDVVNLFVGFLAGPEQTLYLPGTRTPVSNRLQLARHAVAGAEIDLGDRLTMEIEGYWKSFAQVLQVNRNKVSGADPDFSIETGEASGVDLSLKYQSRSLYLWLAYSLAGVWRDDGLQVYPTVFDRRHNLNLLGVYTFGKSRRWEAGGRWNLGSGLPFTQTQGFYQQIPLEQDLLRTDVLTGNAPIGIILADKRNGGRLPYFHRLDLSLKYTLPVGARSSLEVNGSVTNAYDRRNVFYVDRLSNQRVDQLPVLPALGLTWKF
ncbi:MAG: TonB-dependent receptor [Saprospiraceae bacterium]